METTKSVKESVDMKLEVVVLGVSDVDRAKAFYENLGWRLDADFATGDDFRVVQLTPHNSPASIRAKPGVRLSNLAFLSNCRDSRNEWSGDLNS